MTTKNKTQQDVALGEIQLPIMGRQYYTAVLKVGETLQFEREPGNVHDANAIRVENDQFETVGHLPKKEARWLAPLIDQGKLAIDGTASDESGAKIAFFLAPKGASIMDAESADPATGQEALALTLAAAVKLASGWTSPDAIRGLVEILEPVIGHKRSPESRLLRHVLEVAATNAEKKRSTTLIENLARATGGLEAREPIKAGSLTVVPLFQGSDTEPKGEGTPVIHISYAIAEGLAAIEEIEDGVVAELRLVNHSASVILVPEGIVLVGGMQDRVATRTVIVEPHEVTLIPVLCVEQGRWDHGGEAHKVADSAPPRIRSTARDSHDQHEVWAQVSSILDETGQESGTDSLLDAKQEPESIPFPVGAVGAGYLVKGSLIGVEVFGQTELFAAAWNGLLAGYRLEVELEGDSRRVSTQGLSDILGGSDVEIDQEEREDIESGPVRMGDMSGSYSYRDGAMLHLSLLPVELA